MVFDLHCDTIYRLVNEPGYTLARNRFHLDLARMKRAGYFAQVFALFADTGNGEYFDALSVLYDRFVAELAADGAVRLAGSHAELEANRGEGVLSALLAVEDAALFGCDAAFLPELHRMGVRLVTLVWNHRNALGAPAVRPECADEGLTPEGVSFLGELNRLRIVPDISHLNDRGAFDVLRHSARPVAASHSNARAVHPHPRNLSDDLIRAVAESGGVIGLNYYAPFLTGDSRAVPGDVARHARHIADTGGIGCLALGSDFDGIPDGGGALSSADDLPLLLRALEREGFSEGDIDKICHENAGRFFRDSLA